MERTILHVILHFFVPFAVAKTFWREKWIQPFFIMALTIVVDLDHLLAEPIFDPIVVVSAHILYIRGLLLVFTWPASSHLI